jgi:hypothetical protein
LIRRRRNRGDSRERPREPARAPGSIDPTRTLAGHLLVEIDPRSIVAYHLWHVQEDQWQGSLVASNEVVALLFLDRYEDRLLTLADGRVFQFVVDHVSPPGVFRVSARQLRGPDTDGEDQTR